MFLPRAVPFLLPVHQWPAPSALHICLPFQPKPHFSPSGISPTLGSCPVPCRLLLQIPPVEALPFPGKTLIPNGLGGAVHAAVASESCAPRGGRGAEGPRARALLLLTCKLFSVSLCTDPQGETRSRRLFQKVK